MSQTDTLSLVTPSDFPAFPYSSPYQIQLDLMRHLYSSIEQKKIAIIESPTGTGKTLSLLCATLTWLSDDRERSRKGELEQLHVTPSDPNSKEPDWVVQQSLKRLKEDMLAEERELSQRLQRARKREQEMKQSRARVTKRPRIAEYTTHDSSDSFLLDSQPDDDGSVILSQSVRDLIRSLSDNAHTTLDCAVISPKVKLLYVSRTHSQLSQLVGELMKIKYTDLTDRSDSEGDLGVERGSHPRFVVLASRANLCINDKIRKRGGDLDESCRDLLNGDGCPYLPKDDHETRLNDLRDSILAGPKDLEDLVISGRSAYTCPYFATRKSIPLAEIIAMPYSVLLQKGTRESIGVNLNDHIVVVDEAHNLIDAILQLQSTEVSNHIIRQSLLQLREYLRKFSTRLNPSNLLAIKQLVTFLSALLQYTQKWETMRKGDTQLDEVMDVNELISRLGEKASVINLSHLLTFMRTSKIARKVSGYYTYATEGNTTGDVHPTGTPLFAVDSLIQCLLQTADDGRVTIRSADGKIYLKYQQLNPAVCFDDIVSFARCVILAGGTMSPFSDIINQLLPGASMDRITTFSCGHVIPPQNLRCLIVGNGSSDKEIILKHTQRSERQMIIEVGQVIQNISRLAPHGMVVFVPSYSFLDVIKTIWSDAGILARIQKQKQIFYEPRDNTHVDETLAQYQRAIYEDTNHAALLFAVVGAKLSEGLNFSDDLARCVVVLGLPFANLRSQELKERMRYIDGLQSKMCQSNNCSKSASMEMYENLCMRSVNQSIGRAIRHKSDWAALVLVDKRYTSPNIRDKLPRWINESVTVPENFGHSIRILNHFFKGKAT